MTHANEIGDDVLEAVALMKAERSFRPVNHVRRQRDLNEDEWVFVEDNITINARPSGEFTTLDQKRRRDFYEEVRAICRKRGWKGDAGRERAAKEIYPRYEKLPSGKAFTETRALSIAKRGTS